MCVCFISFHLCFTTVRRENRYLCRESCWVGRDGYYKVKRVSLGSSVEPETSLAGRSIIELVVRNV